MFNIASLSLKYVFQEDDMQVVTEIHNSVIFVDVLLYTVRLLSALAFDMWKWSCTECVPRTDITSRLPYLARGDSRMCLCDCVCVCTCSRVCFCVGKCLFLYASLCLCVSLYIPLFAIFCVCMYLVLSCVCLCFCMPLCVPIWLWAFFGSFLWVYVSDLHATVFLYTCFCTSYCMDLSAYVCQFLCVCMSLYLCCPCVCVPLQYVLLLLLSDHLHHFENYVTWRAHVVIECLCICIWLSVLLWLLVSVSVF